MDNIELEVKILDVHVDQIEKKLEELGAQYQGDYYFQRFVYDFSPKNNNKWIRLRTDGVTTTLTIKEIISNDVFGVKEMEIKVSDFNLTNQMLIEMGYKPRSSQENKRSSYILNGVNIEIDTWPMIPPYLEVEGDTEEEITKVVEALGFNLERTTTINTKSVYLMYGINLDDYKNLTF